MSKYTIYPRKLISWVKGAFLVNSLEPEKIFLVFFIKVIFIPFRFINFALILELLEILMRYNIKFEYNLHVYSLPGVLMLETLIEIPSNSNDFYCYTLVGSWTNDKSSINYGIRFNVFVECGNWPVNMLMLRYLEFY